MKAISFSLYGSSKKYSEGMLRNVELSPSVYPGWKCVVHVSTGYVHTDVVDKLRSTPHVVVVSRTEQESVKSLFWRIETFFNDEYERVLIRDADSRLNAREADAEREWEESGKSFHTMRDHVRHNIPMMGGMWGALSAKIPTDFKARYGEWTTALLAGGIPPWARRFVRMQSDQNFLNNVLWPVAKTNICIHDDRQLTGTEDRHFRVKLPGGQFVGQQWNEKDEPIFPR